MSTEKIDGTVNLGGQNLFLIFFMKLDYVDLTRIIQILIFKTMQGRFRHWLTPGVQLVKRSRDWSGKVKQQERLGLGGIH